MLDDAKLKKLRDIIDIVKADTVSPDDLIKVINLIIEMVAKANKGLADELSVVADSVAKTRVDLRTEYTQMMEATKTAVILAAEQIINETMDQRLMAHDQRISDLEEANEEEDDSNEVADTERKISEARSGAVEDFKKELPSLGVSIRDALENLVQGEKLPISALEGYKELIDKLDAASSKGGFRLIGGTNGIQLYVNGVKKGTVKYINLVPGTGITITHVLSNGRNDITIAASGGGGGFTKLTATGTINGNNAAFTFTQKPTYIIADGAWYTENNGWTWSGSTATMAIPPNSDIYGFV